MAYGKRVQYRDMKAKELKRILNEIDKDKFNLFFKEKVKFDFKAIFKNGETVHTGMGSGADMTELTLISLCDIFSSTQGVTIEDFAESVKKSLIEYSKIYVRDGDVTVLGAKNEGNTKV